MAAEYGVYVDGNQWRQFSGDGFYAGRLRAYMTENGFPTVRRETTEMVMRQRQC